MEDLNNKGNIIRWYKGDNKAKSVKYINNVKCKDANINVF